MKKIKKERKPKTQLSQLKISEMIIGYAYDFINLGSALEEKQSYLNAACTAWNISLLDEEQRKKALDLFIKQYKEINPDINDIDCVKHDMELLIKEKLRLYPNEKRVIANAKIIDDKGKEHIVVASTSEHCKGKS